MITRASSTIKVITRVLYESRMGFVLLALSPTLPSKANKAFEKIDKVRPPTRFFFSTIKTDMSPLIISISQEVLTARHAHLCVIEHPSTPNRFTSVHNSAHILNRHNY